MMKTLTIDRMEGIYAICTDKDKKVFRDSDVGTAPGGFRGGRTRN